MKKRNRPVFKPKTLETASLPGIDRYMGPGSKYLSPAAKRIQWTEKSLVWVLGAVWMSAQVRPLKYLLGWLIAGTRGGVVRAQIIRVLKGTPQNANQLASLLERDYRTIRHHLEVLEKNGIITSAGERYGMTYFLSPLMEENYDLFEEIVRKIWEKEKREESG